MGNELSSKDHASFIHRCYQLAKDAVNVGNHPFGAILVVDGQAVLQSQNQVVSSGDNTRHAELELLRSAAKVLTQEDLNRATLYTSTEPCAMCAGAIYWSGVAEVIYGCSAVGLGQLTGGSLVIPCRDVLQKGHRAVTVIGPLLEAEGLAIHQSFW